jgi:Kef-type K+ transport system membrane component KefB
MDTYVLIIAASSIIIFSFFFNIFSKKTNIPSVLMLIILGVLVKIGAEYANVEIKANMLNVLQVLGNVGLVMIVLEAALDLKLTREKKGLIGKSFLVALVALIGSSFGVAAIIYYLIPGTPDFYTALIYAVPLSIMSSAIIIPSVGGLEGAKKEFMVYESTFSDILGIMFFYFLIGADKTESGGTIALDVFLNIIITIVVAIIIAYLLVYVFQKLTSQVKLFLIIAVLMLMYALGKKFHLSSLLFILAFGLVLNNTKVFFRGFLKKLVTTEKVKPILHDFHTITLESAFVIRTFFFVIFGMYITLGSLVDWRVGVISLAISGALFAVRFLVLKLFVRKDITPQLYIAPRGLITILLFFVIESTLNDDGKQLFHIDGFEPGILLFCIIITSVIMTIALISYRGEKVKDVLFGQIPGIKKDKNDDGINDEFEERIRHNVEEQGLTEESSSDIESK